MLPYSPFPQYFDTNHPPSIQDIHHIKDILLDPLGNLRKLDVEIARLQAQREVLYTFINNHPTILSPSRRVPPDIWRLVFSCCLPGSDFPVRTITEAPLSLTRICRSWREIALTTPGLWNAIHINIAKESPVLYDEWYTRMRARIDGVKRWLENSGSLPLRISLSVGEEYKSARGSTYVGATPPPRHPNMTTEALAADLAALLLPYSSRWQTLSLNDIPFSVLETLLGDGVDVLVLQQISFRPGLPDESTLVSRLLARGNCSSLRIEGHIPRGLMQPASFWARLTQLELSAYMPTSRDHFLLTLAELCPSLTACTLRLFGLSGFSPVHPLTKACEWKHLRKLDVTFLDLVNTTLISGVLKVINAPLLTEFCIACDFSLVGPGQATESPIHEFLLRSGCEETLTHLTVDLPRQQEMLVQILAVLPSLKFLRIGRLNRCERGIFSLVNEHLIQALTCISICPRLEELELPNCSPNHVDALLTIPNNRNLKTFMVDFGEQPEWVDVLLNSGNATKSLDALRSKGMRVGWHWHALKCNLYTGLLSRPQPDNVAGLLFPPV
ncbi:hypothetical protein E1B28_010781 [Marasmius oreades]|uniref:F-box domain-containing protein n=1 Tax=Marasmius oreades TaxID=181124 RepID=A0A9P7UQJ0_9AGAR|nr:uncharacterized protein E1B28_010781 [Marasmius oreades]KAG7089071.1 hypothetical protein E1B28_010781 [Marasmius oreades]